MKAATALAATLVLAGCASVPLTEREAAIQFHRNGALVTNCKQLGPIASDSTGGVFNFHQVADKAFAADAIARYGNKVDGVIILSQEELAFGRVILKGTALQCFSPG